MGQLASFGPTEHLPRSQIIDGIKAVKFFAWEEDFFAQVICVWHRCT
jgi:hypothetical protein